MLYFPGVSKWEYISECINLVHRPGFEQHKRSWGSFLCLEIMSKLTSAWNCFTGMWRYLWLKFLSLCFIMDKIVIDNCVLQAFRPKSQISNSSQRCDLSYPIPMFWERRELCNCISQKLKFVCIRGFRGEEQEVEFSKYMITRATMMKRITIISSNSLRNIMKAADNLFSLPWASGNLSMNFKASNPTDKFAEHQNKLLKW